MASQTHRRAKAARPTTRAKRSRETLMVRLDGGSKELLAEAARLRRVSVSDYVRQVMIDQARRETDAAAQGVVVMSPEEQLAFWNALNEPPALTHAQQRLADFIRGGE